VKRLQPRIVITVVRSIAANVIHAQELASWTGVHLVLPYPGRWKQNRAAFDELLIPILRKEIGSNPG
jgi:hypothetical protein